MLETHVDDFSPYGIFEQSTAINLRFAGLTSRGTEYEDGVIYRIGSLNENGTGYYDTFVGVDNEAAGAEIGQWVVDEGLADGTSYGVIGAKNSFIQNQREDSFKAVVDANGNIVGGFTDVSSR